MKYIVAAFLLMTLSIDVQAEDHKFDDACQKGRKGDEKAIAYVLSLAPEGMANKDSEDYQSYMMGLSSQLEAGDDKFSKVVSEQPKQIILLLKKNLLPLIIGARKNHNYPFPKTEKLLTETK